MMKYFITALLFSVNSHALEIKAESDTPYKKAGQVSTQVLKKDETMKLENGEQVLFTGENQVPVLIVAPGKSNATVVLANDQQQELLREATKKVVNASVSEIVSKLVSLENLIKARNFPVAQTMISDLKVKYPLVAAVYFASGTTNFLLNKKTMAAADLERGLELEPENPEAKKLLQRIKGGL